MDLHGQIMNIQISKEDLEKAYRECGMGYGGDTRWLVEYAFKLGCRYTRHKAAELSLLPEFRKE